MVVSISTKATAKRKKKKKKRKVKRKHVEGKEDSAMKTIAEMEAEKAREREVYRSLTYWTGIGLVYKRCCNCHYMPTNPERDRCVRMDKQIREPGWNWNCPGWEWKGEQLKKEWERSRR